MNNFGIDINCFVVVVVVRCSLQFECKLCCTGCVIFCYLNKLFGPSWLDAFVL